MNLMKKTLNWNDPNQDPLMPVIVVKNSGRLSSCLSKAWEISKKYEGHETENQGESEWSEEDVGDLNALIEKEFDHHKHTQNAIIDITEEYTKEERDSILKFVTECAKDSKKKQWV